MRIKNGFASIVLFLSVFMILASCGKKKSEWKGTIEEKNGVTVVKNPKEPIHGQDIFSMEEELSIGEVEGREEFMFSAIRSIAVDEAGRIFVLDREDPHLRVFDQNGAFLRTIGRKGQGPGEFNFPLSVSITRQNELVVDDMRSRLAFFSLEGEFKRNLQVATINLLRIDIDSEGNLIGIVIVREEENPRYELRKFDSELNYLCSFGSSPLPDQSGYNPFMGVLISQIDNNDQVIFGFPENYEIKIFDKEGNLKRKIIKDYDPVEVTEEEIKQETESTPPELKVSIPKYHNAYYWFTADDEGRIFVMTHERVEQGEGFYYDVFDPEGKFIAKIPLEIRPYLFKNKKLYTVEQDEEGYPFVKRYKVTWKY